MKTPFFLALSLAAALCFQESPSRGRGSSRESTELVLLSNYLSKRTGSGGVLSEPNNLNWNEIWDADEFAEIWSKTFLLKPWERYHFLKESYPVPPGYRDRDVDGVIFLIKAVPSDLWARGDATTKEGLWWDFIWMTAAGEVKFGQFPVDALPLHNGVSALALKEPNIAPERIAEYERKLSELGGVTFESQNKSAKQDEKDSTEADSTLHISSTFSGSAAENSEMVKHEDDKKTFLAVLSVAILATIGLLWLLLRKRRS